MGASAPRTVYVVSHPISMGWPIGLASPKSRSATSGVTTAAYGSARAVSGLPCVSGMVNTSKNVESVYAMFS